MKMRCPIFRRMAACAAVWAAIAVMPLQASAQTGAGPAGNFPNKPIHLVIGFSAGGGNDVVARIVGQKLSESFGQPVLVENRTGAGGIIAADYVARSAPDGHTLLTGPMATVAINPAVYEKLPYAPQQFAPVSMIVSFPLFMLVKPTLPIHSVKELVTYAKANPAKASYAAPATTFQLTMELFKQQTGTPAEYVAYKGSNDAIAAVMSGEVLMTIIDAGPASTQLKNGEVRGLAVTAPKRIAAFPAIPTMAEAGIANMEVLSWIGFLAPAGTPRAIVTKIEREVARIVQLPDIAARLRSLELDPVGSTSEEFAKVIAADIARWTAVAKAANIKLQP